MRLFNPSKFRQLNKVNLTLNNEYKVLIKIPRQPKLLKSFINKQLIKKKEQISYIKM